MSETDLALPSDPEGYRWCVQARHGFAIALPRRFHVLANTVDPVARMMRGEAGDDFGGAEIGDATRCGSSRAKCCLWRSSRPSSRVTASSTSQI
jgi:hypothetical protein